MNEEGLTFIELLAVIVILSIVFAIAFTSFTSVQENAKEERRLTTYRAAIGAVFDNTGKYAL